MSVSVWVGVGLLILANALYVAAEFGAVGVRRSRVRRLAADGNGWARRLLPHIQHAGALDTYVGASQIGITVSSLALGAFAQATIAVALAPIIDRWFGLDPGSALPATAIAVLTVLTFMQLILGELIPKALALQFPTPVALSTILPMQWSLFLFRPFLALLNGMATLLLRLVGVSVGGHRHIHSPEEIALMIAESRDGGLLEPEEHQRLNRALHLGARPSRELAVPVGRLTMLPADAGWEEIVRTVSASPFSRIPIHDRRTGRIVGVLRVKDVVERYVIAGPQALSALMRPILEVPEDLPADRVISRLRDERAQQAVLVDAAGEPTGLITFQDLLGELLGESGTEAAPTS